MQEAKKLKLIYSKGRIDKNVKFYNKINSFAKKDFYNVLLYMHLGDDFYRLLILSENRDKFSNIHFIIPKSRVFLLELFNFDNYTIFDVNEYLNKFLENKYEEDFVYETYKFEFIKHQITSFPQKEEVFTIQDWNINYRYFNKIKKVRTIVDYTRACLGIKNYTGKTKLHYRISPKDEMEFLNKFSLNNDLKRIILIAPEARSDENFTTGMWKLIVSNLIKSGYIVVENIMNKQNHIDGAINLDLSLKELILLAQNCKAIISIRSGFCDVIANSGKRLYVLYSKERYDDLNPFFILNEIFDFKRFNKPKEIIIDKNSPKLMFERINLIKDIDLDLLPGKMNKFIIYKKQKVRHHNIITILNIKFKFKTFKRDR